MSGGIPRPVLDAYMEASRAVFITQVPLVGLSFIGTFFMKDRGLVPRDDADEPQDTEHGLEGVTGPAGLAANATQTAPQTER